MGICASRNWLKGYTDRTCHKGDLIHGNHAIIEHPIERLDYRQNSRIFLQLKSQSGGKEAEASGKETEAGEQEARGG